jgi:chromosome segregation ATPase
MDEQAYQYWQVLHRWVALGETLTIAEQAVYESGCQEMDAEERLDGNLERLRELRAQIAAAETEQQHLKAREAELDARIVALEACLDTRTRQLLGISD